MDKGYRVEVETERDGKDTYISVTHNGRQWASLPIKDAAVEIPLIITALQKHLTK